MSRSPSEIMSVGASRAAKKAEKALAADNALEAAEKRLKLANRALKAATDEQGVAQRLYDRALAKSNKQKGN